MMTRTLLEEGNRECPSCGESKDRLSRHWSFCEFPSVNQRLQTLLTGVLLGSGSLGGNGENTKHLLVQTTNETLARWLFDELDWLAHSLRRKTYSGNREAVYHVRTHSHPYLRRQRDRWYRDGEKRIQSDALLSPQSARVWWAFAGGIEWTGDYDSQVRGTFSAESDDRADAILTVLDEHGYQGERLDRRVVLYGEEFQDWLEWAVPAVPGAEYKWARERNVYWILQGHPTVMTTACPHCDSAQINLRHHTDIPYTCYDCGRDFESPVTRASQETEYTEEDIHACIRAAAIVEGEPLTEKKYRRWYSKWGKDGYPSNAVMNKYGWNQACEDAGVQSGGDPVHKR